MDEILQSEDSVGDAVHIHDGLIKLFGNTGSTFKSNEVIKPKISKRKLQPGGIKQNPNYRCIVKTLGVQWHLSQDALTFTVKDNYYINLTFATIQWLLAFIATLQLIHFSCPLLD